MNSKILAYLMIVAAWIVTIGQAVYYAPHLPDTIASHFGQGGNADGWMSKAAFLAFIIGMQFGLTTFLLGMGWLASKLPVSMVNIPHREYWLHEDRAAETMNYLRGMLAWITAATALLMVFVFQLSIQANLADEPKLPMVQFSIVLGVYLLLITAIVIRMVLRFSKVPAE